MITRYRAILGGVALEDVAPNIIITDIEETAPNMSVTTEAKPGGGMYITGQLRQSVSVKIKIEIHDRRIAIRQEAWSRIFRWAQINQYLTVSHRPGQRLYIDSVEFPDVSALKWTERVEMVLTAYQCPWWEEADYSVASTEEAAKSGTVALLNRGDMASPLDVTIVAIDPITTVSVSCGAQKIALTNISVAVGEEVQFRHTDNGIQEILAAGESAMSARNGQSDDEIMVNPGINQIAFSADGNVALIIKVRGRKY